jgi:signal transduction histidine kinase
MRLTLRLKVMLIAVLPLAVLALTTLWIVNRSITDRVQGNIRDDLKRASAVFESMLASRARTLEIETQTIAQDPKFFSVLTLPRTADPQVRATIAGVARDFNAITQSDLFEVVNAEGRPVASVGRDALRRPASTELAREALNGRAQSGIVSDGTVHYQANATPVFAGGRVVGALLVGARIGSELADQLRSFTRSEVTFMVGSTPTASTLESPDDRTALLAAVPDLMAAAAGGAGTIAEVRAPHDVYLTLVRPIPNAPAGSKQCYVMQRSLDDETRFLRDVQTGLLLLGAIALIAAVLAGWVIADRIVAPIKQIVAGAEAMERGDYDYPLDLRRDDEIGYLAKGFADMRQRQRAHVTSLEEAARVKSEFISLASHELRTPISVIKGYQELMLGETIGPITAHQRNALEAVRRSVAALSRVAENATRMAQIQNDRLILDLEDGDTRELLDEALAQARVMGQTRKVALAAVCEGSVPRLRFDRGRLTLALTHLITNGIRFTPDGGQVDVRAHWDGRVLEIAVHDNGVGIPPERHAALFERGAVAHDVRHHHSSTTLEFKSAGLGFGLSIARGIVQAHGGTLTLTSEPDHGSTFVMRLPLEPANARQEEAA